MSDITEVDGGGDQLKELAWFTHMFFVQNKWQGFYFADLHDSNASVDTTQKALISISQILCFVDIDIIHIVNASGISLRFWDQKLDGGNLMRLLEPLLVLALGTDIVFTRWGSVTQVIMTCGY